MIEYSNNRYSKCNFIINYSHSENIFFLLDVTGAVLAPGDFYNFTCDSAETAVTIDIRHEKPDYHFSLAVESLDGTAVTGTITGPKSQNNDNLEEVKRIGTNSRHVLKGFTTGTTIV